MYVFYNGEWIKNTCDCDSNNIEKRDTESSRNRQDIVDNEQQVEETGNRSWSGIKRWKEHEENDSINRRQQRWRITKWCNIVHCNVIFKILVSFC